MALKLEPMIDFKGIFDPSIDDGQLLVFDGRWLPTDNFILWKNALVPPNPGMTFYYGVEDHQGEPNALENAVARTLAMSGTVKYFRIKVTGNTRENETVFNVMKNGVASGITVTVPDETAGSWTDNTNVSFQETDTISIEASDDDAGASGTVSGITAEIRFYR